MADKNRAYLFITGPGRCGTTVMTNFLRAHPELVLGRERYTGILHGGGKLTPALFEKARFLTDLRFGDTHHRELEPYYGEALPRFEQARWIGDKLPNLTEHYDQLAAHFPRSKVIYLTRNIVAVAESFQRRANLSAQRLARGGSAKRLWPVSSDWQFALQRWNEAVRNTLRAAPKLDLLVVRYEHLFRDRKLLDDIHDFLALDPSPSLVQHWDEYGAEGRRIARERVPILNETQRKELISGADLQAHRRLLQVGLQRS